MPINYEPTMMRVSAERKIQLETVTKAIGAKTMNETLGKLYEFARLQGIVDHHIPGVLVNAFPDGVALSVDKEATPNEFSHKGIRVLAQTIRDFVDGSEKSKVVGNMDHNFHVSRRGRGFVVAIPMGAGGRIMSPDLALEFANLIEAESQKAQAS